MHTLLLTGPGGAGTSTVAAATAARAARTGRRTVLLTRGWPVPVEPVVAGLTVTAVDPQRALEELWGRHAAALATALPELVVPPASSVVPLPGVADLALLAEIGRAEADLVVVDAGPLEAGIGLLALPGLLRWWLEQLLPTRLRMLGAVRTAAVRSGVARRGPVDAVLDAAPAVEQLLGRVALADPRRTEVRLVALPQPAAVVALRRAVTALGLHGQRPAAVLTRVPPVDGPGEWWAQRAAEQAAALAALGELAPVVTVPERARAPQGAEQLARLLPDDGPAPVPPLPAPAPVRVAGGWRLVLPLPFADRGELELTRCGDDLVVTAGAARRAIRLDALLRRCVVTAGVLAGSGTAAARLEVAFAPDPGQWPADLLASQRTAPATGGSRTGSTTRAPE